MADVKGYELLDAALVIFVAQIGEDDDVGDLADRGERLDRARHDILPMHLAVEEAVEKRPYSFLGDQPSGFPFADGIAETRGIEREVETMSFADPVRDMAEHVEEYLVAVADETGTANLCSALTATTSSIGRLLSASAQPRRTGWSASGQRNT